MPVRCRAQVCRRSGTESGLCGALGASDLMLVCTKCGKPTRVGRKVLEDGTKVRVCKKCSEVVDLG